MLILQNVSYTHPDKEMLFQHISFVLNKQEKVALIGNNGSGKSTLLKMIAGLLEPSSGMVKVDARPYYIPQVFGQFNHFTIAQALGIEQKLQALSEVLQGNVSEQNLELLAEDWTIEERCREALQYWKLDRYNLDQKMESLSGGEKTKVFLAGISIHQPEMVLLDEPSNHLDTESRQQLYAFIRTFKGALLMVSHDRTLLNLVNITCEISKRGLVTYGGDYTFYQAQKAIEANAFNLEVKAKEKALRKAKETERESMERQLKLDARGKKKQEKAGLPTIVMNTLRNNAEKSTARVKGVHAEKVGLISDELNQLRKEIPDADKMKFGFDDATLHQGKILVTLTNVSHAFGGTAVWKDPLNLEIRSGERVAIKGSNGSGKTTLIKIMLGGLTPAGGEVDRAAFTSVYIDQDYSLIDNHLSVYEQASKFNTTSLQEHEVKIRLSRFLFTKEFWDKPCSSLSGGEKMRLVLCCLTISNQAPDMIVMDEPTNNLDIQNIDILTNAINEYSGTLLVVSHDEYFLEQVNVRRTISLA